MLLDFINGQTSIILRVKIRNSSLSTGAGLTGLTSASTGLIISTIADTEPTATTYTQAGSTIDTITTLGTFGTITSGHCKFKEVDATNHKGIYEIQIANARYAVAGAKSLLVSISGAANAVECDVVVPLRAVNPYSATTFMTGVNGLAPPTNWNLESIDGSGRVLLQPTQTGVTIPTVTTLTNIATANVTQWSGNNVVATHVNGVPIVDVGYVIGNAAAVSSGTAQAGANGSITLASSEPATNGFYVGRQLTIVAGTAFGQARFVTAYNGSTKVATVHRNWDVNPDATSQYSMDSLVETDVYQFAGQNVVLDGNNLPNVNAKDWNGAAIATSTPNTASVNLNLSQAVPTSNTAQTVGDALNAARAQGFGKWQLVGTTLTLYAPDGTTAVRTFSLDSVSAPTVRT
jgi:hypothetical protein